MPSQTFNDPLFAFPWCGKYEHKLKRRSTDKPRTLPRGIERMPQRTRSTGELLYIDQHIFNESQTRRKNLAMACIDYKKAYDMVPQSWRVHYFKMYKIPDVVIKFTEKTIETWRVELIEGGKSIAEVKIQRGIFQGGALSPLLFVIAMMPLNHIIRKCTAGYKISKSQEKINHLIYIDDIKLFAKKKKRKKKKNRKS